MHIAFNGWFWDQPNTGSGQYIYYLLHYLRRVAPELELSLILPQHIEEPGAVPLEVNIVHTRHVGASRKLGKVWFEQNIIPKTANEIDADILHVPYWGGPLSSSVKVVTSVLDVIPLIYPVYASGVTNRMYMSMVSTAAKTSHHVITLSESAKLDIEDYLDIPEEKITAIYLAPDDKYHPRLNAERDEEVRQKYNLPDQYVLYMGGFDVRKRVNELMLAYTYVSEAEGDNIPLVLAGRNPQWGTPLFPDLPAYAEKLAISDYVQWIGYVDDEDKPALYRMADVFVYPSEYEGFGLPPLEAMASGTPTITADIDVFDEILEDGAYLINSAREMAGAIIALLIQKPLRDTMINQALATATKYNWRKTARQTLQVYKYVYDLE